MSMYGGVNNGDYSAGPLGFYSLPGADARRIRFNLASAVVDTAASRVASLKPTPRFQTNEASAGTYLKARKRSRILEGQFHDLRVHKLMRKCFFDGAIADIGIIYGYLDDLGRPRLERVLPMELIIDENECRNGDGMPRSIYRYHLIDKEKLSEMYPSEEDKIITAPGPSADDKTEFFLNYDERADQVVVIEGWHLGSYASPGRHCISLGDGHVLHDEPWDETEWTAAFAFYRWKESQVGFHGVSICEEVAMAQHTINEHIRRVQQLQRLGSNAYVMVPENSGVRAQQLSNLPLQVIKYRGQQPNFVTVTATPPDLQNEVDRIVQQTMQQLGLSPGGMQGTRSPGVTSGIAIQTLDDLQSQRHAINAMLYEDFAMDVAKLISNLNDKASELNPDYELSTSGKGNTFTRLRWQDVMIDDDDVRVTCQPVSALPTTPAGRTDMIEKWLQMGVISNADAMKQLDFPDTGDVIRRAMVDFDYAAWQVERILDGQLVEPVPYQNLDVALQVAKTERLFAEMDNAPPEIVEVLEDFIAALMPPPEPAPPPTEVPQEMGLPPDGMMPPPPEMVSPVGPGGMFIA